MLTEIPAITNNIAHVILVCCEKGFNHKSLFKLGDCNFFKKRILDERKMDPDTLMMSFNADAANMDNSDKAIVQMALKQVQHTLKDLGVRASQGYALGYELGYIKGVLEHVLKTVPDSVNKEAYMKGYVSGYIQGMLYSFKQGEVQRGSCPDNISN